MSDYNWGSSRRRYEWKDSYEIGTAPRDLELEKDLFGEDNHVHSGINFSKYDSIKVTVSGDNPPPGFDKFENADLHPVMKENVALCRYSVPTPVQRHSISVVTAGRDLMACAQTGSGKTAAFLVPTCSRLFANARSMITRMQPGSYGHFKARPLVLILAPTRELCTQIFDESRRFCYRSPLRPCAVYGGAGVTGQLREIEKGCDVLIAAPGRLCDFIQRGKLDLSNVQYLILDEADRMLDMGFEPVIRDIVERRGMNRNRQTLMYSATFPKEIRRLARDFLKPDYLFLRVGRVGGTTTDITQRVIEVDPRDKRDQLVKILMSQPPCRTLIFTETKRDADTLDQFLFDKNFPCTSIHGDRSQMEREDALQAFKSGVCPILVATAVVARGIDVRNVMHVVNYDLPKVIDEYIHRIGRTARVGNAGLATSFFTYNDMGIAKDLTKVLQECKQEIPEVLRPYMSRNLQFDDDDDDDEYHRQRQVRAGVTQQQQQRQAPPPSMQQQQQRPPPPLNNQPIPAPNQGWTGNPAPAAAPQWQQQPPQQQQQQPPSAPQWQQQQPPAAPQWQQQPPQQQQQPPAFQQGGWEQPAANQWQQHQQPSGGGWNPAQEPTTGGGWNPNQTW